MNEMVKNWLIKLYEREIKEAPWFDFKRKNLVDGF